MPVLKSHCRTAVTTVHSRPKDEIKKVNIKYADIYGKEDLTVHVASKSDLKQNKTKTLFGVRVCLGAPESTLSSAAYWLNLVNTLKPTFSNVGTFVFRHLSLKTLVFISVHLRFLQQYHGGN